jgi:hypothetical protein
MKALLFNHHPDLIWFLQKSLQNLDIECFIATNELTLECGSSRCSTSPDFKLQKGPKWYSEEELFEINTFNYKNNLDDIDLIFTWDRDIINKITFDPKKLFFCACVSWDLNDLNDFSRYKKITSHHNAERWGAYNIPHFVSQRGEIKEKKFITQLITDFTSTPYYGELIHLKNIGFPIAIGGRDDAPSGILDDWEILKYTSLLVHHKTYGTNCFAVMKALDSAIPVYISKENKLQLGMGDLPDDLFIYSNNYSIIQAYEISLNIDNKKISRIFREIRNVENTSNLLKNLI